MKKLIASSLMAAAFGAWAQPPVKVDSAWVRGTVAAQKATGAFMRITSNADARLLSAESPVAGVVEIHEMAMENDVMRMRQVPGLDLSAGRTLELKPGGYHVMLMDLKQPLKAGEMVPITLVFEDGASQRFSLVVNAPVTALGGGSGPQGMKPGMGHGAHKHQKDRP